MVSVPPYNSILYTRFLGLICTVGCCWQCQCRLEPDRAGSSIAGPRSDGVATNESSLLYIDILDIKYQKAPDQ